MAQINGTVVAVEIDVPVKKNGGGTYQGWSLVYKDNTGEIKTMSKHMNSLKYAQPPHCAQGLPPSARPARHSARQSRWRPRSSSAPGKALSNSASSAFSPAVACATRDMP